MTVFWTVVWLVLAFGSHHTNWILMIALGVFLIAMALWANVLAATAGVHEEESGILLRSLVNTSRYEWNQLTGFCDARKGTHDYVYAELADGSRRRLTNVLQGQRVVWDGGETRDIVGVLNERLAEWRATRG
jgi:hypothetical protein